MKLFQDALVGLHENFHSCGRPRVKYEICVQIAQTFADRICSSIGNWCGDRDDEQYFHLLCHACSTRCNQFQSYEIYVRVCPSCASCHADFSHRHHINNGRMAISHFVKCLFVVVVFLQQQQQQRESASSAHKSPEQQQQHTTAVRSGFNDDSRCKLHEQSDLLVRIDGWVQREWLKSEKSFSHLGRLANFPIKYIEWRIKVTHHLENGVWREKSVWVWVRKSNQMAHDAVYVDVCVGIWTGGHLGPFRHF